MTWLFNGAIGSVIVVTLFHAAYNMSNNELIPDFMLEMDRLFGNYEWLYVVLGVLALVLIVFARRQLSYKAEHAVPAAQDAQEASSSKVERRIPGSNISSR